VPTFELIPHPSCVPPEGRGVSVQVHVDQTHLALVYSVDGDVRSLVRPPKKKPYRADNLWLTTCFELFVKRPGEGYLEFNFSPSYEWAVYSFERYRSGMTALAVDEVGSFRQTPSIWTEYGDGVLGFHLGVTIDPLLEGTAIGLSAIVEEADGTKSYWSLAHPPGAPDFHHAACFVARLPAPARS